MVGGIGAEDEIDTIEIGAKTTSTSSSSVMVGAFEGRGIRALVEADMPLRATWGFLDTTFFDR